MATKPPSTPNLPKTEAVSEPVPRTIAAGATASPTSGGDHAQLLAGQTVNVAGHRMRVCEVISPVMQTGQAAVYLVSALNGDEFALKVYAYESDHRRWPYAKALRRLQGLSSSRVMKLHDFGLGGEGLDGRYSFELCEHVAGEGLGKIAAAGAVDPAWVRKVVVPQLTEAVEALQSEDLVHCDLKPENILVRGYDRRELVVVDLGSSKCLDNANHESVTSMVLGTQVYGSPELAHRVISDKVDTYGIGATVLALFRPDLFVGDGYKQFRLQQDRRLPVVDLGAGLEDLTNLVNGLLVSDRELRWGLTEIKRWIQGEKVEVRYREAHPESQFRPIKVAGGVLKTVWDLLAYLDAPGQTWVSWLNDAGELPHSLRNWAIELSDDTRCNALNRLVKRALAADDLGAAREAISRFFHPECAVGALGEVITIDRNAPANAVHRLIAITDEAWVRARTAREPDAGIGPLAVAWQNLELSLRQLSSAEPADGPTRALVAQIDKYLGLRLRDPQAYESHWHSAMKPEPLVRLAWWADPHRGVRGRQNWYSSADEVLNVFLPDIGSSSPRPQVLIEVRVFLECMHKRRLPASASVVGARDALWEVGAKRLCAEHRIEDVASLRAVPDFESAEWIDRLIDDGSIPKWLSTTQGYSPKDVEAFCWSRIQSLLAGRQAETVALLAALNAFFNEKPPVALTGNPAWVLLQNFAASGRPPGARIPKRSEVEAFDGKLSDARNKLRDAVLATTLEPFRHVDSKLADIRRAMASYESAVSRGVGDLRLWFATPYEPALRSLGSRPSPLRTTVAPEPKSSSSGCSIGGDGHGAQFEWVMVILLLAVCREFRTWSWARGLMATARKPSRTACEAAA
jgi:hypothetical protein